MSFRPAHCVDLMPDAVQQVVDDRVTQRKRSARVGSVFSRRKEAFGKTLNLGGFAVNVAVRSFHTHAQRAYGVQCLRVSHGRMSLNECRQLVSRFQNFFEVVHVS